MGSSEKGESDDKENVYEDEDSSDGMDGGGPKREGEDEEMSTEESNEETTTSSTTTVAVDPAPPPAVNPETDIDKGTPTPLPTTVESNNKVDDGAPLDIGEHYLVRRTDSQWC